jgi:hypothetical protein
MFYIHDFWKCAFMLIVLRLKFRLYRALGQRELDWSVASVWRGGEYDSEE